MRMKSLIMAAALAVCAFTSSAFAANEATLCAGRQGGGYDGIMRAIGTEVERKADVAILNLGGSEEIIDSLADGQCSFGPAQGDIYYKMTKDNQAISAKVVPVAVLYNEVMTLVCSKASGYDELADIQAGDKIIVDVIGSGSALTWDNMVEIEKEFGGEDSWSKASPEFTPLDEAGAALSLGQAKCAFGVGKAPIAWATDIEKLGGVVSEVSDKDLNDLEFNGASLYEPAKMPRVYKTQWWTYKVPAVLFRSAGYKNGDVEKIVKRVAPAFGQKVNTVP